MRARLALVLSVVLLAVARAGEPKVGEWTLIHEQTGSIEKDVYAWLEKADEKTLTVCRQELAPGRATARAKPERTELAKKPRSVPPGAAVSDDIIEVKGKKLAVKKVENASTIARNKVVTTRWISADVPLDGVVREVVVREGKEESRRSLLDWGESGGAEKPLEH
jgi:hypothetical protein